MGKSKKFQRSKLTKTGPTSGKKDRQGLHSGTKNVFQVKHTKANRTKHKTKAVTSTLSKVLDKKKGLPATKVNQEYRELQDMLHRSSVPPASTQKKKEVLCVKPQATSRSSEPVNIDETMEQLSSL